MPPFIGYAHRNRLINSEHGKVMQYKNTEIYRYMSKTLKYLLLKIYKN